ncbi:MAG: hypothetical protein E7G18_05695 [Anaerococcus hydrogenalis]|uniref:hypothetical protein n=1 Tax=Anaerococcus hydrogenalis TaxID=33029 RepID=UPI002910DC38|nr:hypothetical protein [Anaerococcus hydrogenalis]MDU3688162.1 hypothetical protein [Anaerococcus hydrogenalis]
MLNLKNVKKINNWIYADYYPEDWNEFGSVSVNCLNINDYEIKLSPTDEKEYSSYPYATQALNGLRDMVEGKKEIKDCKIMWY